MYEPQQSRWRRPTRRQLLWAGASVGLVLLTIAVLIGYRYDITLWDWLKLLVVPAVIAGGGVWFNRQQRERELEIAERRAQDEALQAYLDQMSGMLLPNKEQPSLYKARPGDSLSSVARARTLTVLPRLDGERKARVVQFLYESGLISKDRPVLVLNGAALREATLNVANLRGAVLVEVDLGGAALGGADLREASLVLANLSGADLSRASLGSANLRWANLSRANLSRAYLSEAYLGGANLRGAGLSEASLSKADLGGADLVEADLGGADLGGADLRGADLTDAEVNVELVRQVLDSCSLESATLPNGQKYEDWLNDNEAREEGGENSSPS